VVRMRPVLRFIAPLPYWPQPSLRHIWIIDEAEKTRPAKLMRSPPRLPGAGGRKDIDDHLDQHRASFETAAPRLPQDEQFS